MTRLSRSTTPHTCSLIAVLALAVGTISMTKASAQAIGCSAAANAGNLACNFAAKDDLFTERAICMDSPDDDLPTCLDEAQGNFDEVLDECGAILEAQIDACDLTDDAAHVPEFGAAFAGNFVDPLDIGGAVDPNPFFPLVQGNSWTYEGTFEEDGEMITENHRGHGPQRNQVDRRNYLSCCAGRRNDRRRADRGYR